MKKYIQTKKKSLEEISSLKLTSQIDKSTILKAEKSAKKRV